MSRYRRRLLDLVNDPAVLQRFEEPVRLASGELSREFIDAKRAVERADDLDLVGAAMFAEACREGVTFDAVGGLVLGSVPFTFAVSRVARCSWFMVRKEPKGRGTNQWVEGVRSVSGLKVMLVDDVVTTGGSIVAAHDRVTAQGAEVVFASTLVDRGTAAAAFFADVGVPYVPLLTYADLGIEPVGSVGG